MYETFRRMRPGIPLLALFGRMNQTRRMCVYQSFFQRESAILFATDIAARGLDFPKVNWVLQLDCPPNTDEYIHRVGRTARYHSGGQALLVLLPSESKFIKLLEKNRLSLSQIAPNRAQLFSISDRLSYFCAEDNMIKYWAQRAYINYVKSIAKESNKQVFDITQIPLEEFSLSLGLPIPPKVRYLSKVISGKQLCVSEVKVRESESTDDGNTSSETDTVERDLLRVKRRQSEVFDDNEETELAIQPKRNKVISKISSRKKLLKKNITLNSKLVFDEEGNVLEATKFGKKVDASELVGKRKVTSDRMKQGLDLLEAKQSLQEQLEGDKEKEHARVTTKHRKLKQKRKNKETKENSQDNVVRLKESYSSDSDSDSLIQECTPARAAGSENAWTNSFHDLRDTEETVLAMIGHS